MNKRDLPLAVIVTISLLSCVLCIGGLLGCSSTANQGQQEAGSSISQGEAEEPEGQSPSFDESRFTPFWRFVEFASLSTEEKYEAAYEFGMDEGMSGTFDRGPFLSAEISFCDLSREPIGVDLTDVDHNCEIDALSNVPVYRLTGNPNSDLASLGVSEQLIEEVISTCGLQGTWGSCINGTTIAQAAGLCVINDVPHAWVLEIYQPEGETMSITLDLERHETDIDDSASMWTSYFDSVNNYTPEYDVRIADDAGFSSQYLDSFANHGYLYGSYIPPEGMYTCYIDGTVAIDLPDSFESYRVDPDDLSHKVMLAQGDGIQVEVYVYYLTNLPTSENEVRSLLYSCFLDHAFPYAFDLTWEDYGGQFVFSCADWYDSSGVNNVTFLYEIDGTIYMLNFILSDSYGWRTIDAIASSIHSDNLSAASY